MVVFGRESIKNTFGEIKQNTGASPAYAYLSGINFIRSGIFEVGAGLVSGIAQHFDTHFAQISQNMNPNVMPNMTPGEWAVSLGITALATVGAVSGLAGAFRGAESIITSPARALRMRRQASSSA